MRAILVAGNSQLSRDPGGTRGLLAPLVDRTFLQHVVESILSAGLRDIQLVVSPGDRTVRSLLGSGTKWGAQFRYTEADNGEMDAVRRVAAELPDERFLLVQPDQLPFLPGDLKTLGSTLFCWSKETDLNWTGWAILLAADLAGLELEPNDPALFDLFLETNPEIAVSEGPRPLSAKSFEELVDANRRVLSREFPQLLIGGVEIRPGLWVSRNTKVHPTAKLWSPAFLGEHTTVGPMVEVGPAVSIGNHCIIDRETSVTDSIIYSGTHVGERLSLKGVVVDRSKLISTTWATEIEGIDDVLLGNVFGSPISRQAEQFWNRFAALVLLLTASPILMLLWLASLVGWVPALQRESMVSTPTVGDSCRWKFFSLWSFGKRQTPLTSADWRRDFLYCFLPALVPVVFGQMNFVGSKAHTREEAVMAALAHDVEFFSSHTGFLQGTLFDVNSRERQEASWDSGWWTTISLLLRYGRAMIGTSTTLPSQEPSQYAAPGVSRHEN